MKKIKGLQLNIHRRDVLRHLKLNDGVTHPDETIIRQVDEAISWVSDHIDPAIAFETFQRQALPEVLSTMIAQHLVSVPRITKGTPAPDTGSAAPVTVKKDTVQLALWDDCVAVTVGVSTLGPVTVDDDNRILVAAINGAREQADQFMYNLVRDEASREECEIGARRHVGSIDFLRAIEPLFAFSKIHVSISKDDMIEPSCTRFMLVNWIPKRR